MMWDSNIKFFKELEKGLMEQFLKLEAKLIKKIMRSKNYKITIQNYKHKVFLLLHFDVNHKLFLEVMLLKQMKHPNIIGLR